MPSNNITQRISLEGGQEVKAQLQDIGKSGEQAFNNIRTAGEKLNLQSSIGAVEQSAKRAGVSFSEMAGRVSAASTNIGTATAAAGAGAGHFAADISNVGRAAAATGAAADAGGAGVKSFGLQLKALGRATGESELAGLGKTFALLSRNLSLLVPAVVVAGFGKLAESASTSAVAVLDQAHALGISAESFQNLQGAATAAGVGAESFGKAMGNLQNIIKDTASADKQLQSTLSGLRDQLAATRERSLELGSTFLRLGEEGRKNAEKIADSNTRFARSTTSLAAQQRLLELDRQELAGKTFSSAAEAERAQISFAERERTLGEASIDLAKERQRAVLDQQEAERNLEEARRKAFDEAVKIDEEERKTKKAMADATEEARKNGTALQQLGISAIGANGKLKLADATFSEFADKFRQFEEGPKKNAIALAVFGDSARLMTAVLNGGSESVKKFAEAGEKIAKPFTAAQEAIGDRLSIALSQTEAALVNIKNVVGIQFAPGFTGFLENVTALLVELRPGFEQFGIAVASLAEGSLVGLAAMLRDIGGNLSLVGSGFSFAADMINKFNGSTDITGTQLFALTLRSIVDTILLLPRAVDLAARAVGFLIDKFKELVGIKSQANAGGGPGDGGLMSAFAGGGPVRGAGTGTSDSIPAWLSNGEFVMRAAAVRHFGSGFMDMINNLKIPSPAAVFNLGGLAESFMPQRTHFAEGGLATAGHGGGRPTVINIGGASFEAQMQEDQIKRLQHFAVRSRTSSAGRKPTYYGGGT